MARMLLAAAAVLLAADEAEALPDDSAGPYVLECVLLEASARHSVHVSAFSAQVTAAQLRRLHSLRHCDQQALRVRSGCLWLVAGPYLERLLDALYLPLLASCKPTLVALQAEVRRL